MSDLDINTNLVQNLIIRENFVNIKQAFDFNPFTQFLGKFFDIEVTAAVTNEPVAHGLSFVPKDAFLVGQTGTNTITFNYDSFTSSVIDITTTGSGTFRFVAGNFRPLETT